MARQFFSTLAADFPEVLELQDTLSLARTTWKLYGISASELSDMDNWTLEVLKALVRR